MTETMERKSTISKLDDSGDFRQEWSKDNPAEVEAAREVFERFVKGEKKYVAYKTREDGSEGEVIREFDPEAERITLRPQMMAG